MKARPLIGAQPLVSHVLDARAGRITFYSFAETAGAPAEIQLWDGGSAAGVLVADITLAANASIALFFGKGALPYRTGLFLDLVAGAVRGQVYSVVEEDWGEGPTEVVIVNIEDLNLLAGG